MLTVRLPNGETTSQLAMGSSGIGLSSGTRGPLALLEAAFDAGILHFDTAPLYGMGRAERCLGEFLSRHKNSITIATKYGLAPPRMGRLKILARGLARPLLASVPSIRKRVSRVATAPSSEGIAPVYTVDGARASLESSLRELRTDHVHLWLLHEATASSLQDENLLRFLEDCVKQGKVGAFGVGGAATNMPGIYASRRNYCPVIQCGWDALEREDRYAGTFKSRFQVFRFWPARITAYLRQNPMAARDWSSEVDRDLVSPEVLHALTLRAAMLSNPQGLILFESRNSANIIQNAAVAHDPSLADAAGRYLTLLRREAISLAVS